MKESPEFEVIIIGGSYAGLSAAMALGRSLRKVLIIDSGKPCNRQTPHSHNFLTQDGQTPLSISSQARKQVEAYPSIQFFEGLATDGRKTEQGFEISTHSKQRFSAKKLIFATGVRDLMPAIDGFASCWGISVIHCPYCHGYEVRGQKTGILGNGEYGWEFSKMIHHWTKDLTLYTNGPSGLSTEQKEALHKHNIPIIEKEIDRLHHNQGRVESIVFKDGSQSPLSALYARAAFEQHCDIPQKLGCELDENGYIKVGYMPTTSVPGVYACGDNTTQMRAVSNAVAQGTFAGAALNKELIEEEF